jgi:hypothetical protein
MRAKYVITLFRVRDSYGSAAAWQWERPMKLWYRQSTNKRAILWRLVVDIKFLNLSSNCSYNSSC